MNTHSRLVLVALAALSTALVIGLVAAPDEEPRTESARMARMSGEQLRRGAEDLASRHSVVPAPASALNLRAMLQAVAEAPAEQEWVDTPDGTVETVLPDGRVMVSSSRPTEPKRDGVLTPFDFMHKHGELSQRFQKSIDSTGRAFEPCVAGIPPVTVRAEWSVIVHLKGDGEQIRVVDVEADDAEWPPYFTPAIKECYLAQFRGKSWASTERLDLKVEYPLCVNPSPTAEELLESQEKEALQ